jgi:hypothetical protein
MIYCVYSIETGLIRYRFETAPQDAAAQLQAGEAIYPGEADPALHYIDVKTGERGDLRNRNPGDGSTWDELEQRWMTPAEIRDRTNLHIDLEVRSLEQRQARPIRELWLDAGNATARAVLADLESQIAALRAQRIV